MKGRADLAVEGLSVSYGSGTTRVTPLSHINLRGDDGQLVVVRGPSGCGKSTLLSVLAGLLTPDHGRVTFGGSVLDLTSRSKMLRHRRHSVGMVFQSSNLISSLTALENVMAPLLMSGVPRAGARRTAHALLDELDMGHRLHHRPGHLSGGQQQRVALARGLVRDPPLVLADEPTAHLDRAHVDAVLTVLRTLARPGRLVVVTTHDDRVTRVADRVEDLGAP